MRVMRATCVRRLAVAVVCLLAGGGGGARAEARGLRLADCLRLAGQRAPGLLHARGVGAVVRARRGGEARLLRDNPELALALGPRWTGSAGRALEVEVGLSQRVEVAGRRGARVAMVDAEAAVAVADGDEARRLAQREAGLAFVAVLAARERAVLAARMVELGEALRVAVERRVARSEATALELALAQVAEARARAQLGAQVVEERRALAQLGGLLGQVVRAEEVDDDLGRLAAGTGAATADGVDRAPLLRGLEAERRLGLAEGRSGSGWGLTLGLSFAREGDEAKVLLGTLALELPLFERGQQQRAVGRVRARSAAAELAARRTALEVEQRETRVAATEAARALVEADKVLAPAAAEAARLLQLTFEAGELRVSEVLVARRELLDAGRDGIELRVAAASAALEALLSTAAQP